jgi:hypothetical protein
MEGAESSEWVCEMKVWGIHDKDLSREKTLLPALPRRF